MGRTPKLILPERVEHLGCMFAQAVAQKNWDRCHELADKAEAEAAAETESQPAWDPMELTVAGLPGLSLRIVNALEGLGAILVRDLLELQPEQVLAAPNCGPKTLCDIRKALRTAGIRPHGS